MLAQLISGMMSGACKLADTHTHTRQELDHCSDPSGTESQNVQLERIYIYSDKCICIILYIWDYRGHQLRLKCAQVQKQSPARSRRYVYTGPGEVSSLITGPPGPG